MPTYSDEAWRRLGDMLIARRVELDSRYKNRRVFSRETGLEYKLIQDIEKVTRTNFRTETLASLEIGYRLKSGSIRAVLAGGEPTPASEAGASFSSSERRPQTPPDSGTQVGGSRFHDGPKQQSPDYPSEIDGDTFLQMIWDLPWPEELDKWAAVQGVLMGRKQRQQPVPEGEGRQDAGRRRSNGA